MLEKLLHSDVTMHQSNNRVGVSNVGISQSIYDANQRINWSALKLEQTWDEREKNRPPGTVTLIVDIPIDPYTHPQLTQTNKEGEFIECVINGCVSVCQKGVGICVGKEVGK